ncbi:MAG: 6-carboxy-5,6,7,8-tetrahydropterin synthase [Nitrospirales bacterium]|nr:MAG: 6-carboxy-5,6,7,8-tetrahydropterin synthase [Nitrospirales bacterium]
MATKVTITQAFHFSAAHRLHTEQLSLEVNRQIFGKCNNLHGHGHNYTVFVTVCEDGASPLLRGELNRLVTERIVRRFDHQHLNYDPAFQDVVTTGENLAKLIWGLLVKEIPDRRLQKIGVLETRDNYFEYVGD